MAGEKEQRNTRFNLHNLILQLEDPRVPVENKEPYKVDAETVGILYAYVVSIVDAQHSPALTLAQHTSLHPEVMSAYKKNFQHFTRNFFAERVGELIWRQNTAQGMREKYRPSAFNNSFTSGSSIERVVRDLALKGEFWQVGERVKEGAKAYHEKARGMGMNNYRFAAEYNAILKALVR